MVEQYAHSLSIYLQTHPHMSGLIIFMVAFIESLPIAGTIIPGSITLTAVGILVGTGVLHLGATLLWAILGAFLGDLLSYLVGNHYKERLRTVWPFKSRPQWLEAGEKFFRKHGGKSIYIGRFTGPLRSLIPLIAGILHMPWQKFVLAAIPAAALWAIAYMLPGILLGAVSLQLPPAVATKFILILLLLIFVVSIFAWALQFFYSRLLNSYHRLMRKSWRRLRTSKRFSFIAHFLADKNKSVNYHQLTWLFLALIFIILFGIVFLSVMHQNILTGWNRPIFEFLRTVRHITSDRIFIGITLLGDSKILLTSGFIIFFWLLAKKYNRDALHWLAALSLSVGIPLVYKLFFYFPRPGGLLHTSTASSFPSGHTFQAVMFYGFLATLISTHLKPKHRRYPYYIATTIVILVGFSRLYLGAHWLTDVLASITLGLSCLALVTISYRRNAREVKIKPLTIVTIMTTLIIWSSLFMLSYQRNIARYSLLWPSKTITENTWWGQLNRDLPTFRQNRFGKPSEPMNLQYAGDVQQLKSILVAQGWRSSPDISLIQSTLQKLTNTSSSFNTLLPSLYLNHPPILFMFKDTEEGKLILRLWDSNVYFAQTWEPVYIGNVVEYQMDPDKEIIIYSFNVTPKLAGYLNKPRWRVNPLKATTLPTALAKKNWQGEILQINAPTFY